MSLEKNFISPILFLTFHKPLIEFGSKGYYLSLKSFYQLLLFFKKIKCYLTDGYFQVYEYFSFSISGVSKWMLAFRKELFYLPYCLISMLLINPLYNKLLWLIMPTTKVIMTISVHPLTASFNLQIHLNLMSVGIKSSELRLQKVNLYTKRLNLNRVYAQLSH